MSVSKSEKGSLGGYSTPAREWDEATPTDSTFAKDIDDEIVEAKQDTRQRLCCQHWFGESGSLASWQWEGAHRAGMVNVIKGHDTCAHLKTWCDQMYGPTTEDWKKFYGALHYVHSDPDPDKRGLYRMDGTGTLVKIADAPSVGHSIET